MKVAKYIFIITSISLTLTTFNNCDSEPKSDCDPETFHDTAWYYIPAIDSAAILYSGFESLKFKVTIDSQVVDTVVFKGSGRAVSYWSDRDYGDCKHDRFEIQTITFKNTQPNSKWGDLIFEIKQSGKLGNNFTIYFRDIEFFSIISNLQSPTFLIDGLNYYNEIEFEGHKFYNVLLIAERRKSFSELTINDPKLYYIRSDGIVRIHVSPKEHWDIIF
jgi:hypothetical protein